MTKDDCLNTLEELLECFVFGSVAAQILSNAGKGAIENWPALELKQPSSSAAPGAVKIDLAKLRLILSDEASLARQNVNFRKCQLRALLAESHETILHYCEESSQIPLYKAQLWFQYARIVRNIASHKCGGVLRKWPDDLSKRRIRQVTWRHRTLSQSMVGTELVITAPEILRLHYDQREFVQNTLA